MSSKKIIHYVFLVAFIFINEVTVAQCAMCKAVIEGENNNNIAKGVNNGITYLLVFPYLVVGVLAYFLVRYKRKAKN